MCPTDAKQIPWDPLFTYSKKNLGISCTQKGNISEKIQLAKKLLVKVFWVVLGMAIDGSNFTGK